MASQPSPVIVPQKPRRHVAWFKGVRRTACDSVTVGQAIRSGSERLAYSSDLTESHSGTHIRFIYIYIYICIYIYYTRTQIGACLNPVTAGKEASHSITILIVALY